MQFQAVSPVDSECFFGYYDKPPWDSSSRFLLGLNPSVSRKQPTGDDSATVGLIDLQSGSEWIPLATTYAWNWQQGSMLHWLPSQPERLVTYNTRVDSRHAAVIHDVTTGGTETLTRPIYALSPDGSNAISVNFSRIARTRPGYGYEGVDDPGLGELHPDDDGIWMTSMMTGESDLIITLAKAAALEPKPSMDDAVHWFNHLQFSPDGSRFLFLHRWSKDGVSRRTRMLTAGLDGSDERIIADDEMTSHFDWRDRGTILAWATKSGLGDHYYLFDAITGEATTMGEDTLTADGHCSYSPDRKWILSDMYPDDSGDRVLFLYNPKQQRRIDIGRLFSPPELTGPLRCDLHPRWSRDGRSVCIDSAHEGYRRIYIGDASDIVDGG